MLEVMTSSCQTRNSSHAYRLPCIKQQQWLNNAEIVSVRIVCLQQRINLIDTDNWRQFRRRVCSCIEQNQIQKIQKAKQISEGRKDDKFLHCQGVFRKHSLHFVTILIAQKYSPLIFFTFSFPEQLTSPTAISSMLILILQMYLLNQFTHGPLTQYVCKHIM